MSDRRFFNMKSPAGSLQPVSHEAMKTGLMRLFQHFDLFDGDVFQWTVFGIGFRGGDLVEHLQPFKYFTEYGIPAIEMGGSSHRGVG